MSENQNGEAKEQAPAQAWMTSRRVTTALICTIISIVAIDTLQWGNAAGLIIGTVVLTMVGAIICLTLRKPRSEQERLEDRKKSAKLFNLTCNACLSSIVLMMATLWILQAAGKL